MNVANNYKKIILIVAMISMAGVTFGITMPLSTLTLKSWGISSTLIGLNSAMPALAAVLTTPFMPKFINYWGQTNVIKFCLVLVATCCICLPLFPDLFSWFILRFLLSIYIPEDLLSKWKLNFSCILNPYIVFLEFHFT